MDKSKEINREEQLTNLMGLGNSSIHKSYYPELQSKINELKMEKDQFKRIFSDALSGIFQSTMDGNIFMANPALAKLCHYVSTDEILAMVNIGNDIFSEKADFDRLLKKVSLQKNVMGFYTHFKTPEGTKIDVSLNASIINYKGSDFLECFVLDISEQKKAQNYISSIINSMPSILIGVDADGLISQWNETAEKEYSIKKSEALGSSVKNVLPYLKDEISLINKMMSDGEQQKSIRKEKEVRGKRVIENIRIYPLSVESIEGAVIIIDDITEQVRIQEMMIQSEKMLSVGGLAAGMAHEINNPLAGIMQTSSVMKTRLLDSSIPANIKAAEKIGFSLDKLTAYLQERGIPHMFDVIMESGKRVSKIIDNILNFSRRENKAYSTHDPVELFDSIVELATTDFSMKKQYDFKNIQIIREYERDLPQILCVKSQIQQVLLNILKNGAEAMSEQKSREKSPILTLRLKKENKSIRMEIEDNGPGLDHETKNRIFEPFFTTKPVGIGTGLGLSVSYFIITENHKGTMEVVSSPGEGARFIIRLPLEP